MLIMSFSKISVMKIVKQISLTMTFKSESLLNWFISVSAPKKLCAFLTVVQPGR